MERAMRALGLWFVKVVRGYWLLLLLLGAIAVAYLALRTPASPVASVAEVDAILGGGQPALVEFFSNT
jgi:hypothetical protein